MGPLPYPHRATFLASRLSVSADQEGLAPYAARLLSVIAFDHLVRHPVVTLGDLDDERLTDDAGRLLDADHPHLEDSIDWFFRVSRRHEVLWFELSIDRARARARARAPAPSRPVVLHSRRPDPDPSYRASSASASRSGSPLAGCRPRRRCRGSRSTTSDRSPSGSPRWTI
jgi:hypothetical protein